MARSTGSARRGAARSSRADVRRFGHVINKDGVLGTHRYSGHTAGLSPRLRALPALENLTVVPLAAVDHAIGQHETRVAFERRRPATGDAECSAGRRQVYRIHSGLAPENLTTLPHFSISSATSFPKSAGEPGITVPPKSASRAFILRSAKPALISLLSFWTISFGVFLGAATPYQALAS